MSNEGEVALHPDFNSMAAFVEGRLAPADHARFVGHLTECRECRDVLGALGRAEPETSRAHSGFGSRRRTAVTWLSLAATAALATSGGLLLWRTGSESGPGAPRPVISQPVSPAEPPVPAVPLPGPAPPVRETTPSPLSGGRSDAPPPGRPGDLSARRSAVRQVGRKTFRLVAGEWVDADYDPLALLPVEHVQDPDREALLARVPELRPYAALGPRVVVVHAGLVYRFSSP